METTQEKYILLHSNSPDPALEWVEKQTHIKTNYPRMLSGAIQGELLMLLAKICKAKSILEIGCFTGYSTICLAKGLSEDGHIDTLEINDELEELIREGWKRAGVSDRAELHIGDALSTLTKFALEGKKYDLVYIDANKREYLEYYLALKPLLHSGSVILADDVMLGAKVYECPDTSDKQTKGLIKFNEYVKKDPEVEIVMLPIRDGLSIIRVI